MFLDIFALLLLLLLFRFAQRIVLTPGTVYLVLVECILFTFTKVLRNLRMMTPTSRIEWWLSAVAVLVVVAVCQPSVVDAQASSVVACAPGGPLSPTFIASTCCAINTNTTIECWGSALASLSGIPTGSGFVSIVGSHSAVYCALRSDGMRFCWGDLTSGNDQPGGIGTPSTPQSASAYSISRGPTGYV